MQLAAKWFLSLTTCSATSMCVQDFPPRLQPITRDLITVSSADKGEASEIQPSLDNKVSGCWDAAGHPAGQSSSFPSPCAVMQLVPRRRKSPTEEGDVGGLRTFLGKTTHKAASAAPEKGNEETLGMLRGYGGGGFPAPWP